MLTIKDIKTAERNGITEGALRSRISNGWSKEDALTFPMRKKLDKYYDIAKKNGISKQLVRVRHYQYGWSLERAATEPKQVVDRYLKDYKKAVNNGLDLSYQSFLKRIEKGWTVEEAITTPKRQNPKNKKLNEYQKYRDIALANGISFQTYSARVRNYGWNYERAATEPINKKYQRKKKRAMEVEVKSPHSSWF
ncbi:hypothetical protein NSA56_01580 [Oceanobacillus caeni]|uniref:hypothetical protein n=1 Tax=Oceanobacillus caeni TaxID=405946 RepID=UPI00214A4BA8|nr:hypothetical protein [Oceanobacillus caeni]MCR1833086.1 hypothetical protein [Oceanobacillus caeni]